MQGHSENTIDIHDRVAQAYYGEFGEKIQQETQQRLHWIRDNVVGDHILDVGCSQGIGPILLARQGKTVLGVDISQQAVDEAKVELEKENDSVKEKVDFIVSDFLELDIEKNQFETITITEVLEHLYHPEEFITKAYDLLKEDGRLIVTVPFGINDHPDHKKTYYYHDIYQMFVNGFNIINVSFLGKWIGFIAEKNLLKERGITPSISLKQLKSIEDAFYVRERELTTLSNQYLNQRNQANLKYRNLWDKVRKVTVERNEANEKYKKLWDKVREYQKEIQALKEQHQKEIQALKEQHQKELTFQNNKIKSSPTFKLGYLLIHQTKTFKDILKLPFRIRDIKREKLRNISSNSKNKYPLTSTKIKNNSHTDIYNDTELKPGISVIIPAYKSEKTIERVLVSLEQQIISKDLFEVLIIINGEKDATEDIVKRFQKSYPNLNIRVFILKENGASLARNKGLNEAQYSYIALIDADDSVSPNYLSSLYKLAKPNTIVCSQIVDIYNTYIDANNYINSNIVNIKENTENILLRCHSAFRINGCKLIYTPYMKEIKFETSILNGEDGVFYAELYTKNNFDFKICKEAIYFRFVTENSISRQPLSYNFNVIDRLKVISKNLLTLQKTDNSDVKKFIEIGIHGQIGFINKYLEKYPKEYNKVINEIENRKLINFPYDKINKPSAEELVISYCFVPYVDTSAIVMAKRILERDTLTDVVYANMSTVREKDKTLETLIKDNVVNTIEIQSSVSFSNWESIQDFSQKTLKEVGALYYESVYSRAMWPGSHFAAYEYKIKNPNTKWIAEFSDPILFDIHGKERYAKINDKKYLDTINQRLKIQKLPEFKNDNLFFWCEYLVYAFADEIVFTNKNQLSYMLEKTDKNLQEIVQKKSIIKSHPILPKKYYTLEKSHYSLDNTKVNFAYFGAFYQTRKLNDLVEIIKVLPREYKEKITIHVFTNTKDELFDILKKEKVSQFFKINNYLPFFEFLNLVTKFDCLIVNDAITKPEKSINPYLPSKLSDYIGGNASIWALYEKGSILSISDKVQYKSELSNIADGVNTLRNIIDNVANK
jgi:glycosyltransferase involved in cell wall biosynthesis/ubiquinone/menaquinone biosynthesis C-methylase UbiE